jgi:hypothetical protein
MTEKLDKKSGYRIRGDRNLDFNWQVTVDELV